TAALALLVLASDPPIAPLPATAKLAASVAAWLQAEPLTTVEHAPPELAPLAALSEAKRAGIAAVFGKPRPPPPTAPQPRCRPPRAARAPCPSCGPRPGPGGGCSGGGARGGGGRSGARGGGGRGGGPARLGPGGGRGGGAPQNGPRRFTSGSRRAAIVLPPSR